MLWNTGKLIQSHTITYRHYQKLTHAHKHSHTHSCTPTHTHAHQHTHKRTPTHTHAHTHTDTNSPKLTHTNTHNHRLAHIHTYSHTFTQVFSLYCSLSHSLSFSSLWLKSAPWKLNVELTKGKKSLKNWGWILIEKVVPHFSRLISPLAELSTTYVAGWMKNKPLTSDF